jgi:thiamine-phosphate pyrophosphorylase
MRHAQSPRAERAALLHGVYLILDAAWASRCSLLEVMREAMDAGIQMIQYRDKTGSMQEAYARVKALRDLAPRGKTLFIVNDRCDLALSVEADGVHLGQHDLPIELARAILPADMLIGLSTHSPDQVKEADRQRPDYVGFGPIRTTGTKADHEPVVGVEGMRAIRSLTTLPVFAIGGIVPDLVPSLLQAGADGVAVASGILNAPNRHEMVTRFIKPFQSTP